jgi:lysozyme
MIWQDQLRKQLERHEGRVNHAYQDHLGFWTIGIGRLIDQRRNGGLSDDEVEYLFNNDLERIEHQLRRQLHWFPDTPDTIKQVLCNMAFQLGVAGLMRFRRMLAAIKHRDWTAASIEALDSNWARQTPTRAAEIAAMIRSVQR